MDNLQRRTSSRSVSTPSRQSAFSILELLVVIGMMAVLAAMTMAVGPGLLRSSAMSSSLSSVASAVSLARSEAIRSRKQTFFVLAPDTGTLDERSFAAYAVVRKNDATNYSYVTPWKKLPSGVLFKPDAAAIQNQLPTNLLPYPRENGSFRHIRVISFVSYGALADDSDLHP